MRSIKVKLLFHRVLYIPLIKTELLTCLRAFFLFLLLQFSTFNTEFFLYTSYREIAGNKYFILYFRIRFRSSFLLLALSPMWRVNRKIKSMTPFLEPITLWKIHTNEIRARREGRIGDICAKFVDNLKSPFVVRRHTKRVKVIECKEPTHTFHGLTRLPERNGKFIYCYADNELLEWIVTIVYVNRGHSVIRKAKNKHIQHISTITVLEEDSIDSSTRFCLTLSLLHAIVLVSYLISSSLVALVMGVVHRITFHFSTFVLCEQSQGCWWFSLVRKLYIKKTRCYHHNSTITNKSPVN